MASIRSLRSDRSPEDGYTLVPRRFPHLLAFQVEAFGRPRTAHEIRILIQQMATENPLWGAPRIHGELLKLGFDVSQATVSRYMPRRRLNPDQTWKTFIRNHMDCSAAINFLVVPTLTFRILYVVVIMNLERRNLVHPAVTAHPTSAWTPQQVTEAFPWDDAPRYFIRDQDCTFGATYKLRLNAMGISEKPVTPQSPCSTLTSSGASDRYVVNVWIMSSSETNGTFGASSNSAWPTSIARVRIFR